jgi:hypothetical protein
LVVMHGVPPLVNGGGSGALGRRQRKAVGGTHFACRDAGSGVGLAGAGSC